MSPAKTKKRQARVPVAEIFFSRQGEGLYCGQKQVFIRFAGCNLDCAYCDEPAARLPRGAKKLSLPEMMSEVDGLLHSKKAASASLTGGEPLLFPAFLNRLIPALKRRGLQVHLETNGTLPTAYSKLRCKPDVVATDIKLHTATGRHLWKTHERFLKLCRGRAFVKTVLDSRATENEVSRAIGVIASVDAAIPLFWQPATPNRKNGVRPATRAFLERALAEAGKSLKNVRILPQMHVLWGVK